eukprot:1882547-Pyramimonas_sp.AAC.1
MGTRADEEDQCNPRPINDAGKNPSSGVLKPAPRLGHPHNLLSKRKMLRQKPSKPLETSPHNGRERDR